MYRYIHSITYILYTICLYCSPSGAADSDVPWSKARLAEVTQFKQRIEVGLLPADDPRHLNGQPIYMNALMFVDK